MPLNITTENPHYALLESEQPYGPSYGVQYLTPTGHFMQVEDISWSSFSISVSFHLNGFTAS